MMSLTRLAAGVALAALALLPSLALAEPVIDLTPPSLLPDAPVQEQPQDGGRRTPDPAGSSMATGPGDQTRPAMPAAASGQPESGSSHEVDSQPMLQTRHFGAQVQLECGVAKTPNDLLLVNRGFDPLPAGTRIKWQIKSADLVGYFAIIGELQPGEALVADDVVNGTPDRSSACVARAI